MSTLTLAQREETVARLFNRLTCEPRDLPGRLTHPDRPTRRRPAAGDARHCASAGRVIGNSLSALPADVLRALLPATAKALIDALGVPSAAKVMSIHHGRDLYVPRATSSNAGKRLAAEVGLDIAARLIAIFAGRRLYVPQLAALERHRRDSAMRSKPDRSVDDLVDEFNVTRRTVLRKRQRDRERGGP